MQKQPGIIRIKKTVFVLIAVTAILVFVTPVLADYLGPNRTTTESHVETYDYGVWADKNDTSCNPKPGGACIQCTWEVDPSRGSCAINPETATYYSYKLGTTSEVVTTTVNLPPATISGAIQNCALQNGWCVTSPTLSLNSNEPLSGYRILAIEGTLNGVVFACANSSCSVPLNEGNNNFTYWAISSWGDSSTMGSISQKVDTVSPNVGLDISGTNGTNGWYVSLTTVTANGSDSTSGLSEALLSVDGGAWQPSAVLNDGVYDIAVKATDNAGNISNSSRTISVDTTTPSLNATLNGTAGNINWYISNVTITALASDATSGISLIEFSADGGAYQSYSAPISFSDGHHTYQFKATDKAGNVTESPLQAVSVDTTFPAIAMTDETKLGEKVFYSLQDEGSKLAVVRVVIDDEDERFPKVVWQETLSGNKFREEVLWDGKFADGKQAPFGTYYVTIKVSDVAGNETRRTGSITVEPFSFLQPIPPFRPPTALIEPAENPTLIQDSPVPATSTTLSTFGGTITSSMGAAAQSVLLSTGTSSSSTLPPSNIPSTPFGSGQALWGTAAAALIGWATATALEEQKRRKEEEERQRRQAEAEAARLNAAEAARKAQEWQAGQNMLNALIEDAQAQGAGLEEIAKLKETAATQGLGVAIEDAGNLNQSLQQAGLAAYYNAMRQGEAEAAQKAELAEQQAGLEAYYEGRKQGEVDAASSMETSWWEKIGDWFAPKADNTVTIGQVALTAKKLKDVTFTPLDSGMVSVSSNRPPGMRADYLDDVIKSGYDFPAGGNYAPGTIASRTATGLIDDAIKGSSWIIGGLVSAAVNLYDFGKDHTSSWGDFSDATIEKQEFWVSTIVDTVLTIAIGVVAALAVGATLVALSATAPLWGTALLVGGVAIAISVGVSALEIPEVLKIAINSTIDNMQNPSKSSPLHPTSVSPIIIPTPPQVTTTPSFIPTEQAAQPTTPTIQPVSVQSPTPSSPTGTPEP